MALVQTAIGSAGIVNSLRGRIIDTAADVPAIPISVGFTPTYVRLENLTDRTGYEWFSGQPSGTTLKTIAAGTRSLDTGDAAIAVDLTLNTVTFPTGVMLQSKEYAYEIQG